MKTLTEYIKEVNEREAKATSGPWKWEDWNEDNGPNPLTLVAPPHTRHNGPNTMFPDLGNNLLCIEEPIENKADADFIAHARQDIPTLVRLLEKALEQRDLAVHFENSNPSVWSGHINKFNQELTAMLEASREQD